MGMGFKFQMGMGMKSLKWEGIGTKNLFPHTSHYIHCTCSTPLHTQSHARHTHMPTSRQPVYLPPAVRSIVAIQQLTDAALAEIN